MEEADKINTYKGQHINSVQYQWDLSYRSHHAQHDFPFWENWTADNLSLFQSCFLVVHRINVKHCSSENVGNVLGRPRPGHRMMSPKEKRSKISKSEHIWIAEDYRIFSVCFWFSSAQKPRSWWKRTKFSTDQFNDFNISHHLAFKGILRLCWSLCTGVIYFGR